VPVGSTGEFYAMSDDEHKQVIKTVVEEVNGRLPVFAGTGRAGTRETLALTRYAQEVGADGVQIVLPYYHIPSEEGMYQHFKTIAEGIDIGIIIYNNPAVSGSWINPPLMARLSEIDNIIGDKENTPDIMRYYQMQKTVDPAKMAILCGLGAMMFTFEAVYGCPGFITMMGNFAPQLTYGLYEAAARRDFDKVRDIGNLVAPFFDFIAKMNRIHGPHTGISPGDAAAGYMYVSVVKKAMDLVGLCDGRVRLPLVDITEEETAELRDILAGLDLSVK